jgi:hypothetical protein
MNTVILLLHGISGIFGLVGLVCFVLVVVKMFQNNQTGLGIASIVLLPCCGIGYLLALVMGWVKSGEWNIGNVMLIWTGAFLVSFVTGGIAGAMGGLGTHSSTTFQTVGQSVQFRP